MKEVKVLVCDPIDDVGVKMLKEAGYKVDLKTEITAADLIKAAGAYDALVVRSRTKVTKEVLQAGKPRLQIVARSGVGLDNVDTEAAKSFGIQVVNSAEAPSNAVAELVLGYMLSLSRNIAKSDASMKRGEWAKNKLTGFELNGKTIGIVGFGRIGFLVGKKTKALGMRVLCYDVMIDKMMNFVQEAGAESVPLDKLLAESDFVTVHVPLLPQTRYMFNAAVIAKMKKGAYIINAARGGIIEEKALVDALKSGQLAGAALDVYEEEPTKNMDLVKMENVVCTPHIGAESKEAQLSNSTIVAEKLIKVLG
ncbi:MAG: hydroxyacid dehydrogenase [Candidatus Bathyarchaeota archaeon]|nr:hydroxyacid dehydrogenase [Candidatus Bathyarchaeota archaeon]